MADGSSFWYAENAPANTVIYKVDPQANTKTPLFDTARLREELTQLLGNEPPYQGLPFEELTFIGNGETEVAFTVADKEFNLRLDTYEITPSADLPEDIPSQGTDPQQQWSLSPDGRWSATLEDHNIWLRSTGGGGSVQLTNDGIEDYEWSGRWGPRWVWWSPDSSKLAVTKVDSRQMPTIPIVNWLGPREEVEWQSYFKIGEPVPQTELFVFDLSSNQRTRVADFQGPVPAGLIGWRRDGSEVLFFREESEWNVPTTLYVVAYNPETGDTRTVFTETQERQIWPGGATLLEDGKRLIWTSDRTGWYHLYLYDLDEGFIQQLTDGAFPVAEFEAVTVDEEAGWVYVLARGDQERPYDTHLYRVNLEGEGFTQLTEATGQHEIQFAPSKKFFIDTHSTVDRPPTVELRKADGTLLRTLAEASIDSLHSELRWSPPEEFIVQAADGVTDLWGVLFKPYDFSPNRKYPVIEVIYGGPDSSVVPKSFTDYLHYYGLAPALAQLGFITFIVDGRGTPERGREFQNVVYGNQGRFEIPDHVVALEQLAAERSYMDLGRVGILGQSRGGYFATRALLSAPDVYHVGIASAPVMFPVSGTDFYFMPPPAVDREAHEYASNLRLAGNLEGNLLLIHGTSDDSAPFSHTMKMVDVLIHAGKPYDLLIMPGQGHSLWRLEHAVYWREAIRRYFQEHLKP